MIWDVVIAYFGVTLAVAGWNVGAVNCWPVPFSMIFATIGAQMLYPNFAAWLIGQSRLPPESAAFLAYMILWLGLEFFGETALYAITNKFKRSGIEKWERWIGAGVGFSKSAVAMLFATTIALHSQNLPQPPDYPEAALWMVHTASESALLNDYRRFSAMIPKPIQRQIIAQAPPTYEPTFADGSEENMSQTEKMLRVRSLVRAIHEFEREYQQW